MLTVSIMLACLRLSAKATVRRLVTISASVAWRTYRLLPVMQLMLTVMRASLLAQHCLRQCPTTIRPIAQHPAEYESAMLLHVGVRCLCAHAHEPPARAFIASVGVQPAVHTVPSGPVPAASSWLHVA